MTFKSTIILAILCITTQLVAQKTSVFDDANWAYKRGTEFFDQGLYGKAKHAFKQSIQQLEPINEPRMEELKMKAELYYAKSAIRLNQADGEKLILDFVRHYNPDPIASEAVIEVGNYYYNAKQYDTAYEFFKLIDSNNLTEEQKSEVLFKKGYALFVRKKFSQARALFTQTKDTPTQYYYPTNYYLGLTHFFAGKYDEAIEQFKRVEKSKKYKNTIPYYICQIYFAEGQYDQLLQYGVPQLESKTTRNRKEISQLVGQAYFELEEYGNALPYLEYYSERSSKMREEDFYQLGFVQYKTQNYTSAIKSLKELSKIDSSLGQNALYILADCYLKTDEKPSARSAFASASRMNYDISLQDEALWNYAKLSYELKYDSEALPALQKVRPDSPHYSEAQTIMSNIFLNTRDYEQAMQIIDGIPNKTPKLRETYQKVAYYRGLQLYKDGNLAAARSYFNKSMQVPNDSRTKALTNYWLGEIAHKEKRYDESIAQLGLFIPVARGINNLPDESSLHTANYTMGYNYLKTGDYGSALSFFKDAVNGIEQNMQFINDETVKNRILGDAIMRTGDCYFKANRYDDAINYYNQAINRQYSGYIYATYQKALIEGLRNNQTDKILALEKITRNHADSPYADDALFQLGITYQELGKNAEAIKPLRSLINNYKTSSLYNNSLIRLGLITYNQGDYRQAIEYYKDVFQNNPNDTEAKAALNALEEIYIEKLGKPDEYFRFLESIKYDVDNNQKEAISFRAAETQFENGKYNEAIAAYNNYLKKYPRGRYSVQAYYNIAESYAVMKQYSPALKNYEKVLDLGQSRFALKALNKAALIAYNHELDFRKSYQYYTDLEKIADSDDLRFDAQLGALRSAYRLKDTNAVYEMANKVSSNAKASEEQRAAANFYLGKVAFDRKDYTQALAGFNKVIRNSDNEQTAEARYLVAYIYYEQRELETAKIICINSNKESSNYPFWVAKSVILLADILAEQGDLFNARAALEALIENYKGDQQLIDSAKAKLQKINTQLQESSRIRNDQPENGNLEMEEEGAQ